MFIPKDHYLHSKGEKFKKKTVNVRLYDILLANFIVYISLGQKSSPY